MIRQLVGAALLLSAVGVLAQVPAVSSGPAPVSKPAPRPKFDAFEVATIKPVAPDAKASRYIVMQGSSPFLRRTTPSSCSSQQHTI